MNILTKKELKRQKIPFMGNLLKIFSEKSTLNGGIFVINNNSFLYNFSQKKNTIIDGIKVGGKDLR